MKKINFQNLGIYAIAPFEDKVLIGAGKWNRTKARHFESIKNKVNGKVILVNYQGKIIKESKEFKSMVYSILLIKKRNTYRLS